MRNLARLLRRIAVTIAGTAIFAVGVVLLVAPGPGLLVIAVALVVFATEYEWARRHLATVRERALLAGRQAAASRLATVSTILFGLGALVVGALLIFTRVFPWSGAVTGTGVAVGGVTVLATMAYSLRELRRAGKDEESHHDQPGPGG